MASSIRNSSPYLLRSISSDPYAPISKLPFYTTQPPLPKQVPVKVLYNEETQELRVDREDSESGEEKDRRKKYALKSDKEYLKMAAPIFNSSPYYPRSISSDPYEITSQLPFYTTQPPPKQVPVKVLYTDDNQKLRVDREDNESGGGKDRMRKYTLKSEKERGHSLYMEMCRENNDAIRRMKVITHLNDERERAIKLEEKAALKSSAKEVIGQDTWRLSELFISSTQLHERNLVDPSGVSSAFTPLRSQQANYRPMYARSMVPADSNLYNIVNQLPQWVYSVDNQQSRFHSTPNLLQSNGPDIGITASGEQGTILTTAATEHNESMVSQQCENVQSKGASIIAEERNDNDDHQNDQKQVKGERKKYTLKNDKERENPTYKMRREKNRVAVNKCRDKRLEEEKRKREEDEMDKADTKKIIELLVLLLGERAPNPEEIYPVLSKPNASYASIHREMLAKRPAT